tara:strand:- start:66 stop:1133 length:1068 start_codon:yes stop_codon:yes gene_type:complete
MTTVPNLTKPLALKVTAKLQPFSKGNDIEEVVVSLLRGNPILVSGFYSDGLFLLKEIHKQLNLKLSNKTFKEQQDYRAEYFKLSNLVLIEVIAHKLKTKKSPSIGWLKKLYPDNMHFFLSFPQIQGMNSAWQWYEKGISIPVLRNKIYPYYGTYFPTRFEHLELFENWLNRYKGAKTSAIDIGIGCGVLTLQMVKHKFQKIYATDINPNAIMGMREFMSDTKLSRKIELDCGYLFGSYQIQSELIVFNPPWLPESHESKSIDQAIYYAPNLFPDFFAEAIKRLAPDGRVLFIFSNLAQITNVTTEHPIAKELAHGKRFKLEKCFKKSVKAASTKTNRDQHWRDQEEVQLWVLSKL